MSDPELTAMDTVNSALEGLDETARARVLRWAADKFEVDGLPAAGALSANAIAEPPEQFGNVGDLIEAARPTTGPERAIVVAYWLQEVEGRTGGWGGREVNDTLRNMGHGLANVTKTLDSLKRRNPQLVMQVGKAGRSRQARKTYKLTTAGVGAVREMVAQPLPEAT